MLLAAVIAVCCCGLACDDEITQPEKKTTTGPTFKTLETGDNLLQNLELAFNTYDETEYDKLLDDDFIFYFSPSDFSSGRTPEQWEGAAELAAYNNFFDDALAQNRVLSRDIEMLLSSVTWTAIPPDDPGSYPGETWYRTRVWYDMSVVIETNPELTLTANRLRAEFVIRRDDAAGQWQLIRWSDDVSGFRSLVAGGTATEVITWGGIKALYQD